MSAGKMGTNAMFESMTTTISDIQYLDVIKLMITTGGPIKGIGRPIVKALT